MRIVTLLELSHFSMKKPASRFGLANLVSQPATETPQPSSVDALLFAPASGAVAPAPSVASKSLPAAAPKTRFTNNLPTSTYMQLHQLSFWDRRDMSAIIDAALLEYFASRPDAACPLPEEERVKRRLPSG